VSQSRLEMDMRLDRCGRVLSSFLSEELSDTHLGLPHGARAHLDRFRSLIESYYVAKLGYFPPLAYDNGSAAFPKSIYLQMCSEFQRLYEFLVDSNFAKEDSSPSSDSASSKL